MCQFLGHNGNFIYTLKIDLEALWLEDGGSQSDISIFEALSRLSNLRRLCLFNFAVGPKLGQALKKLTKLERVFVLPVPSQQVID